MAEGTELGSAFVAIKAALEPLKAGLGDAEKLVLSSISKMGKSSTGLAKTLSIGLTAPLLAIGGAALGAGIQLEEAFNKIRIKTGATGKDLDALKQSFREVFRTTTAGAEDVATALSLVSTRTGLTGHALEDLTKQLITVAKLTGSDIADTVNMATRLFAGWKVSVDEQSATMDKLFSISQKTQVSMTSLLEGLTQSGATFRGLGINLETAAAMLGQWEKEGLNSQRMLTALTIASRNFAKNNIPLEEGLKALVARIKEVGPGTQANALAVQAFGRSAVGMAEAITSGKFAVDKLLDSVKNSKGAILGTSADVQTFAKSWAKFTHEMMLALEPIGKDLVEALNNLGPVLIDTARAVANLVSAFSKLPEPTQKMFLILGGLAAVAGPAIGLVTKLGEALIFLRGASVAFASTPVGLALLTIGGAALYTAKGIQDINDQSEKAVQKMKDIQTTEAVWKKLRDGVALTADEVKAYTEAQARLGTLTDQSKKKLGDFGGAAAGAGGSLQGLGAAVGGIGISTDAAQRGLAGVTAGAKGAGKAGAEMADVLAKVADGTELTAEETAKYDEYLQRLGHSGKGAATELETFQKNVTELAGHIENMRKTQSEERVLLELGDDAQKAELEASKLGVALEKLPKVVRDLASEQDKLTIADALAKADEEAAKRSEKIWEDRGEKIAKANDKAFDKVVKDTADALGVANELFKQDAESYMTASERKIAAAEDERDKSMAAIAPLAKTMPDVYGKAALAIERHFQEMVADAERAAKGEQKAFEESTSRIVRMHEALGAVAGMFQTLAQVGGKSIGGIAQGIGTIIAAADQAVSTLAALPKALGKGGAAFDFTGMMAGFASLIGAIGAAVQGAIQLGKALKDAFTRSDAEKTAADLRRQFHIAADESDQLTKSIVDLSKQLGVSRGVAMDLKLDEIISAQGGVSARNFNEILDRTGNLLNDIKDNAAAAGAAARGGFGRATSHSAEVVELATKQLDSALVALGKHLLENGGLWTTEYIKRLQEAKAAGLELAGVQGLLTGEMDKAAAGLGKLLGDFAAKTSKATDLFKEQQDLLKKQSEAKAKGEDLGAGDAQRLDEVTAALEKERAGIKVTQDEADRLQRITIATFNAMRENGRSSADAFEAVGSSLDTLKGGMDAAGLSATAAFQALLDQRKLFADNKPLLDAVGGVNELALALANLNVSDKSVFDDLQQQGVQAFKQMTDAGFTQVQALEQMKPLLETLRTLHEKRGIAIGDETQALIDQAEQQGILSAQEESTNDVLKEGLSAIIKALHGDLPAAWQAATAAAQQAAKDQSAAAGDVGAAVGGVDQKLHTQGWADWAGRAKQAAKDAAGAAGDVGGAVGGVDDKLRRTDWTGWARRGVDAAAEAKDAVDTVTYGASPGGLTDVIDHLGMAGDEAGVFASRTADEMAAAKDAVDSVQEGLDMAATLSAATKMLVSLSGSTEDALAAALAGIGDATAQMAAEVTDTVRALAATIKDALGNLSFTVPVEFVTHGPQAVGIEGPQINLPWAGTGGIALRPMPVGVGDVPEALIPLDRLPQLLGELMAPQEGGAQVVFQDGALRGIDGASIMRMVQSRDFAEAILQATKLNTRGMGAAVRRAARQG